MGSQGPGLEVSPLSLAVFGRGESMLISANFCHLHSELAWSLLIFLPIVICSNPIPKLSQKAVPHPLTHYQWIPEIYKKQSHFGVCMFTPPRNLSTMSIQAMSKSVLLSDVPCHLGNITHASRALKLPSHKDPWCLSQSIYSSPTSFKLRHGNGGREVGKNFKLVSQLQVLTPLRVPSSSWQVASWQGIWHWNPQRGKPGNGAAAFNSLCVRTHFNKAPKAAAAF